MVGIETYGAYVPRFRITGIEIGNMWNQDGEAMSRGLGVEEKSVPALDEDTITISVEAAWNMLQRRPDIASKDIEALYIGSESHPYAVKPSATVVAEAIGAVPDCTCADLEFACKAGTAGIQMVAGMVSSKQIKFGVSIGADCAQGKPGDALEYTAGAGAAAFLMGDKNPIAILEGTCSYTTDTPDFFRREGEMFPVHGSRFTGKPAYYKHVMSATKKLFEKLGTEASDYDYCVFHSPNAKFPQRVAKKLGFVSKQIEPSLVVSKIGNTYSGSAMLGLAAVLDVVEPDDRILMTSYGSGAGSDSFSFIVTDKIQEIQDKAPKVSDYVEYKKNINYAQYAKHRSKIVEM